MRRLFLIGLAAALSASGCVIVDDTNESARRAENPSAMRQFVLEVADVVLPLVTPAETRYAAGYSEQAFRSLRCGSTQEEVRKALGEPLAKRAFGPKTVFYYSEQANARANYHVRTVHFDGSGRMTERYAGFYVD